MKQQLTEFDVIAAFREEMAAHGLRTDEQLTADGELHRFHVEGDPRNTKNGFYVLFIDNLPAGEFGCWKRGIKATWCAKPEQQRTREENEKFRERIEQSRAERAERERIKHETVAAEATRLWDNAADAPDDHPYLQRKQVQSFGLRVGQWPSGQSALLVPIRDITGKLWSLQAIFAAEKQQIGRDKDFLAGGKKRGCMYGIGTPPPAGAGIIQIAEGYATAATCHRATGHYTVAAFDAYNAKTVAHELRRRYPAATLLWCADNDQWTTTPVENPGLTVARETAEKTARLFVACPTFQDTSKRPTDFNDLQLAEGMDAVREQLLAVIPEPEAPANDNEDRAATPLTANLSPWDFPHVSDKGQPLNTVENLQHLLDEYGITVRYNQISKDVEVTIPDRGYQHDNASNCALAEITSLCARNKVPKGELEAYVKLLADANAYNPVADWITSKPWDHNDRLADLFGTVETSGDNTLKEALILRWLLSAVAAVFEPSGFTAHGVLVFTGAQGLGKTSWFNRLVPADMGVTLEGAMIDPNNKDTVINAISHWLVELGELDATFKKADIARLKSFVTMQRDRVRQPYDRKPSDYQRRTVFFASVNEDRYLIDTTGNRRWWTVPVTEIDYRHSIDMQQVWAQLFDLYQNGEPWHLQPKESDLLENLNRDHEAVDPLEELILQTFDWESLIRSEQMTATDVLLAIGYDRPNRGQATQISQVLKRVTGKDPKRTGRGRFFELPPMKSKHRYGHNDENQPY